MLQNIPITMAHNLTATILSPLLHKPPVPRNSAKCLWKNVGPPTIRVEPRIIVLPPSRTKFGTLHVLAVPKQRNKPQQWVPIDLETDAEKESKLFQKMQKCMQKFEKSRFFRFFLKQMQMPDMLNRFHKVLGSEEKMKLVIYGIGSIESDSKITPLQNPRLQLSLAILMKRKFDWIGEIEVFDPILSMLESKVLTSLGCTVLSFNEGGRRRVQEPTLFFMPHCHYALYDNLLEANWEIDQLNRFIVLGNSFSGYEESVAGDKNSFMEYSVEHILAATKFAEEFGVFTFSKDSYYAFSGTSFHFFNNVDGEDLHIEV